LESWPCGKGGREGRREGGREIRSETREEDGVGEEGGEGGEGGRAINDVPTLHLSL